MDMEGAEPAYKRGSFYLAFEFDLGKGGPGGYMSELMAWDPVKQQKVWGNKDALPWLGGTMTTAGGLVFHGDVRGLFKALDAKTGQALWQFNTGSGISAGPMTYELDGKQYVAVVSGGPSRSRSSWDRSASHGGREPRGRHALRVRAAVAVGPRVRRCRRELIASSARCCSGFARAPRVRRRMLRVCADPDNLPFSSSGGGERGLYVELAELVAARMGAAPEYFWWRSYFGKRTVRNTLLSDQCDAFFGLPYDRPSWPRASR